MSDSRKGLDLAVEQFEAAQLALHDAAYLYLLDEARALSRRFPTREVVVWGGNGRISIEISRRRALLHGEFRSRRWFVFDGPDTWQPAAERRLGQPEALTVISRIENSTRQNSLGACGRVSFKNGELVLT